MLSAQRSRAESRQVDIALLHARETDRVKVVVEMDHHDNRRMYVVEEDYLDTDEFEAFDGRVIAICFPDGRVE